MKLPKSELTAFQRSLVIDHIYRKGGLPSVGKGERKTLRILSWNIERGHQPARIADAIAAMAPDIACLQEVDWGNRRTGSRDVTEFLAERTGMLGLYGIEFIELDSPQRTARFAGGGVTGNALLTRLDPVATFRAELPPCLDWQNGVEDASLPTSLRRRLAAEPRIGRRFGLGAEFRLGQARLIVCSLHLEDKLGGVQGRWAQYTAALQAVEVRRDTAAVGVIAGDFNTFDSRLARLVTLDSDATALGKPAGVNEAEWWRRALLPPTHYADPFRPSMWTFGWPPVLGAKLDWITVKAGEIRDCGIGPFSSSDHRPIFVDLQVPSV